MKEFKDVIKATTAFTSGYGQYYSTKNGRYNAYLTITLRQVVNLLRHPQDVDKGAAQWVIFSDHPSRSAELQRQNGRFYALWFDIDEGNIGLDVVQSFLAKLFCVGLVYSTKSSTADRQKWRGIIPLVEPIDGVDFEIYQECLNDRLESFGITPDRVTERCNQLCYLPNRGDYYAFHITDADNRLEAATEFCTEFAYKLAEKAAIETAIIERKAASLEKATQLSNDGFSPINALKEAYDLENLMLSYGYRPRGGKFVSPNSLSGVAQCRITDFGKKWLSHHGSDVEAGVGRIAPDGKCCSGDAFDLFKFYECGNDYKTAVAKAGGMFKTADGKTITEANQEQYKTSLANSSTANIDGFMTLIQGNKEVAA